MANVRRTLAELIALFADNTVGGISEQDSRDFIVTTFPNISATAPTVNDDSVDGYCAGSFWCHTVTTSTTVYQCADPTVGAAIWNKIGIVDTFTGLTGTTLNIISGTTTGTLVVIGDTTLSTTTGNTLNIISGTTTGTLIVSSATTLNTTTGNTLNITTDTTLSDVNISGHTISATEDTGLKLYDNASNGIIIKDGGDVGVGIIPTEKLSINGNMWQASGDTSYYSNSFITGWGNTGFRLNTDSNGISHMIIDNLTVRQTMSIYELLINQIRATNGNLFVTSCAKCSGATATTLKFEDVTEANIVPFAINDLILAQKVNLHAGGAPGANITYCEAEITGITDLTVSVTYNTAPADKSDLIGLAFVRVGNTLDSNRQDSIYLATDDIDTPFIDIRNDVDSWGAWGTSATKLRLGNMAGLSGKNINGVVPSGYGLWSDNVFLEGGIVSTFGRIGGFVISGHTLTTSSGATGIGDNTQSHALWISGATPSIAKTRLAHDGSGVLANGNIIWTSDGSVSITGSTLIVNAASINLTSFNDDGTWGSRITTNESGISTNVSDIAGNASNITTNANNIALNVTDISGNASNISLNSTNIGLRVEKNDVINQINISTEGIKIDADNIVLSGSTTVDGSFTLNGNALINGTVTADQIVGTTLSAIYSDLGSITAGNMNIGSGAFIVDSAGAITATTATITGNITCSGISTWTGNSIPVIYTAAKCTNALADQTSANTAADTSAVGGVAAATIAGWKYTGQTTIDGGDIQTDTITAAQINVATLDAISANLGSITAGNMNIGSGAFIVDSAGAITATTATISGTVNANAGTFSGTITAGGTIQTAIGTGQRVVIANNQITYYDSSNNPISMYCSANALGLSGSFYTTVGYISAKVSYLINAQSGSAGQVLRSNGTTGCVIASIADGDLPATIARDSELVVTTYSDSGAAASGGKNSDVHYDPTLTPKMWIKVAGTWRGCA